MLFTSSELTIWLNGLCVFVSLLCPLSVGFEFSVCNNGPVILDSEITFYAEVTGEGLLDSYIFEFEDNMRPPHNLVIERKRKAEYTLRYKSEDVLPGIYSMRIKLYRSFIVFHELLVEKVTFFNLTEYINGNMTVSGGKKTYIPVGTPVNITFQLNDPMDFFDKAQMNYVWDVNGVRHLNLKNVLTYNATKAQTVDISLIVNAIVPNGDSSFLKWGFFNLHLEALWPVSNLTVVGNVFLQQGDVFNVEINCNGSPPYYYCWKIFAPNKTQPNMSCDDPMVTTQCSFPVMHFFPNSGVYHIGVAVGNNLKYVNRTVEIHINDVSKKGQLSTVIIPIVCSILGILIAVFGIAFHIHQRKKYSVEVADFDFQQPVFLVEKTFLERLRDSFKTAMYSSHNDQETEVKRPPADEKENAHDVQYGSTTPSTPPWET